MLTALGIAMAVFFVVIAVALGVLGFVDAMRAVARGPYDDEEGA